MEKLGLTPDQNVWAFAPFDNEDVDEDGRKSLVPAEIWKHVWKICRETGYISHGFAPDEDSALTIDIARSDLEKKEKTALNAQLQIKPKDIVIARKGQGTVLAVGIAAEGDGEDTSYVFKPKELAKHRHNEDPHPYWWNHCTRVKWLQNSGGLLPANEQAWFVTLRKTDRATFERIQPHLTMPIEDIVQRSDGHRPGNPTKNSQPKRPAVEGDVLKQAIAKLKAIYAGRRDDGELTRLIESREEVLREYQPLFSPDGIAAITAKQFRSFLSFGNNRHWSSIARHGSVANDMRQLRKALKTLLDESQPVARRLDALAPNGKPKIPRLAQAILTPILLVAHPTKYGVWNGPSTSALKNLGVWPTFRPERFTGTNYAILNELLLKIAKGVGVDLWTLDALLWRVENGPVNGATEHNLVNDLLTTAKTRAVLLYGPAGTGKTLEAGRLAETYRERGGMVQTIQFHPAYAYEDFIVGLKPESMDDGVAYPVKPGVFKKFCDDARTQPGPHLFVIDEINRGNIAKVFGELMYCLEYRVKPDDAPPSDDKGKSGWVRLPYADGDSKDESAKWFSIPDNVHILGTMNSSDRSVALLDVALRRRFSFVELRPEPELLKNVRVGNDERLNLANLLQNLNDAILKAKGRHYLLGHSYFLPRKYPEEKTISLGELKLRWFHQILPLLEEYFADDVKALREIIGDEWDKPGTEKGEYFVPVDPRDVDDSKFINRLIGIADHGTNAPHASVSDVV